MIFLELIGIYLDSYFVSTGPIYMRVGSDNNLRHQGTTPLTEAAMTQFGGPSNCQNSKSDDNPHLQFMQTEYKTLQMNLIRFLNCIVVQSFPDKEVIWK